MTAPPIDLADYREGADLVRIEGGKHVKIHPDILLALLDAIEAAREVNEAIKQAELTPEGSNLDLRAVVALGQALARFQP